MTDLVTIDIADRIATLTLDDGKANAFSIGMSTAIRAALDQATAEAEAVIITGRPDVLSGGFDLKVIRGDDEDAKRAMRESGVETLVNIFLHPQPVIIACTGHSVAAGGFLLLTGDHRIGTRGDYKIGLNEVAIGLPMPQFGLEFAHYRLDPLALNHAVLSAVIYNPDDAAKVGYLDEVADVGALMDTARAAAEQRLALDQPAYAETKRRLRAATAERIMASMA